jgi:hypothetical protein
MPLITDLAVLLDPDRPDRPLPSHTAMQGRLAGEHAESCDTTASKIAALEVRGSTLVLTLSDGVEKAIAEDPKNYLVMINGGNYLLPRGAVSYDPRATTVTLRGIPFSRRDHIRVTVLGLWDRVENIPGPSVTRHAVVPPWRHRGLMVSLIIVGGVALVILIVAIVR